MTTTDYIAAGIAIVLFGVLAADVWLFSRRRK